MKLNTAPANMALLSNVGEIGEFRIRNSAKAFNILSSGLYANKIRAIIRELSCNAVDSHVAAGRADVPFEVHIPTPLEPWFSVRDFGLGLDHDQVTNIYTTYFESTKTESNDFIGALGLGSKSPFSYTENFTVTAIKNGIQRIYTAFINAAGVPSVALMSESETSEHNGVEVKFSVKDHASFRNWRDEAAIVFCWFRQPPNFTGASVNINKIIYVERDIIPGVHQFSHHTMRPVAVMGNIAYPIHVPNAQANLGSLAGMLDCPIEMHFEIGELDFQASREGLSYIPETIQAIKSKLALLSEGLSVRVADEAEKIKNEWHRAEFLYKKYNDPLFKASVIAYCRQSGFDLFDHTRSYRRLKDFRIPVTELSNKYNIKVTQFSTNNYGKAIFSTHKAERTCDHKASTYVETRVFLINTANLYIVNDTKSGAQSRVRYHFSQMSGAERQKISGIVILEKADPEKVADFDQLLQVLRNPPQIKKASELMKKPAEKRDLSRRGIMVLEKRGGYRRNSNEPIWNQVEEIDADATYYYLEMDGNEVKSRYPAKSLFDLINRSGGIFNFQIHGVRKNRIEEIRKLKNWIPLETEIERVCRSLKEDQLYQLAVYGSDFNTLTNFTGVAARMDKDSDLARVCRAIGNPTIDPHVFKTLLMTYCPDIDLKSRKAELETMMRCVHRDYPLLKHLQYNADQGAVFEYIQMIDQKKKSN